MTATDLVALGNTGLRVSRLGFGTGSKDGRIQRKLGRRGFNRLVGAALDRGVTFFDTAEEYRTHRWLRRALKGVPRERYFLLTKMPGLPRKPMKVLRRYLRELGTDYLDGLLIHCATKPSWPEDLRPLMDAFDKAKEEGLIRAKGVSCHGLPALARATGVDWVDVHMVRINHTGRHMDGAIGKWNEPGDREPALKEIRAQRETGRGMIGMKLIGDGHFKRAEEREESIRFAVQCNLLDSLVIGFENVGEIDEAIGRIDRALSDPAATPAISGGTAEAP
jgi:Aldo/keto reductase family